MTNGKTNGKPNGDDSDAAIKTKDLDQLADEAERLRSSLDGMRMTLSSIKHEIQAEPGPGLREANEQLVLAALQAERIAAAAARHLGDASLRSQHDPLTDLPNRAWMLERLRAAISLARRQGSSLALAFLDIDRFQLINDALGHAGGDAVLQVVAQRLHEVVRESDTVSRYSGDEFLVLLTDIGGEYEVEAIGEKMLAALAEPFEVDGRELRLAVSIGIARYPHDGRDAATLIQQADVAMYRAKRRIPGSVEVHHEELPAPRGAQVVDVRERVVTPAFSSECTVSPVTPIRARFQLARPDKPKAD